MGNTCLQIETWYEITSYDPRTGESCTLKVLKNESAARLYASYIADQNRRTLGVESPSTLHITPRKVVTDGEGVGTILTDYQLKLGDEELVRQEMDEDAT